MKKSGSVNCSDVSNSLWPLRLYSPPSFSVHVILQTRILECVSIPFSRESSQLRDQTWVSCTAGGFFTEPPGKPSLSEVSEVTQSCPTLCDPMDCSPPRFSVHWIFQARVLEWVAISFSSAWKWKVKVKLFSHVKLLATPRTAAYQAPLSIGFSRQEYWSGVPLPSHLFILDEGKHWQL